MNDVNDWNRQVIEEFRANGGAVGGQLSSMPLLLLHHRGARSGQERVNPLAYQQLGDDAVAVFASKGGAPTNPDWYHNLLAHPDTTIEIGAESYPVRARVAEGDERERIFDAQKAALAMFAEYAEAASPRQIPVIVLERA